MIDDELLAKFDRIQDLPVSEEMLGAYVEGNADICEITQIEFAVSENCELSEFVDNILREKDSILENIESQISDPSYHHILSDDFVPKIDDELVNGNFHEGYLATACSSDIFTNELDYDLLADFSSPELLLENNFSDNDSLFSTDQSIEIESHDDCEDMFNNDSIDI